MNYKDYINKLKVKFFNSFEDDDFLQAALTGERILKIYEENSDMKSANFANDVYNLACVYHEVGKVDMAINLYLQSSDIIEKIFGQSVRLADILNNIAICYNYLGEYNTAEKFFKRVINIRKTILSKDHPDYVFALYNIGCNYYDKEDYDKAIYYHMESLKRKNKKDLDYVDNLNFLGYDFESKGDIEKAVKLCQNALDLISSIKGANSEEYMSNVYYIANLYEKNGDYESSLTCYNKAIVLLKQFIGENHPYYADALNKLADIYLKLNNNKKSLTIRMKALKILKNTVGNDHIYYANCLKSIADIHRKENEFMQAKPLYIEELQIKEKIMGLKSEEYLKDLIVLSSIYTAVGEFENASQTLKTVIENIDKSNESYIECILDLAKIYELKGENENLYYLYKKLLEVKPEISFDDMIELIKK